MNPQPLPAILALDERPEPITSPRSHEIKDARHAEHALRRIAADKARRAELERDRDYWIGQINDWFAHEAKPLDDEIKFNEGRLIEWARRQREADPSVKSIRLPSGQISSRAVNPRIQVTDEQAVVEFLRSVAVENNEPVEDYLKVEVRPKLDRLKGLADICVTEDGLLAAAHGQPIPGVRVEPGDVSFKVVT